MTSMPSPLPDAARGAGTAPALAATRFRRQRGVRDEAIMQGFTPGSLEVALHLALPILADDVVTRGLGRSDQGVKKFVFALAVVERRDQRLKDRVSAVVGAAIAPLLKVVSTRHKPVNVLAGLVLIETVLHAQRNLVHGIREPKVGRRVIHRVRAHDQQQVDLASLHVGDEFFQSGRLIDRLGFDRVGVGHGVARSRRSPD